MDASTEYSKEEFRNFKITFICFCLIVGGLVLGLYLQKRSVANHLKACSKYIVASLTQIKYRSGTPWIVYQYTIDSIRVEADAQIKASYTGNWWYPDVKEIEQRSRFIVQVNCQRPGVHQLRWDLLVPASLQGVPGNGWQQLPRVIKVKP